MRKALSLWRRRHIVIAIHDLQKGFRIRRGICFHTFELHADRFLKNMTREHTQTVVVGSEIITMASTFPPILHTLNKPMKLSSFKEFLNQ